MKSSILSLKDLTIGYKDNTLLENLNVSIERGQFICLLGSNGCGKSTLLHTLSYLQNPIQGSISIKDRLIQDYSTKERAKELGLVLSQSPASPQMTVEEVVATGRIPYTNYLGTLKEKDQEKIKEALECVKMQHFTHRTIGSLSDGERQRVMIAKTLAQETDLILLDEPTAFLDFNGKIEMLRLLSHLAHQQDKAILLSIHDLAMALQIADLIWVITPHKILEVGTPKELAIKGSLDFFLSKDKSISFNKETLAITIHPFEKQ